MSQEITLGNIKVGNRYFIPYTLFVIPQKINYKFVPYEIPSGDFQSVQYLKIQIYQDLGTDVIVTIKHFELTGNISMDKAYVKISKIDIIKQGIVVIKPTKQPEQ